MFRKLILYFLIAICIIACANRFYRVPVAQGNIVTDEMIDQLETGLTSAQVQFIMGSPSFTSAFNSDRWEYIGTFSVGENKITNVHYVLTFDNGKLKTWNNLLDGT